MIDSPALPEKDDQNLREIIVDSRPASKAPHPCQVFFDQFPEEVKTSIKPTAPLPENSKEQSPEPKEVLEPLDPFALKQELIELKNESAKAKSLNKSMIVSGSPSGKQPQPKWPTRNNNAAIDDMKKLQ